MQRPNPACGYAHENLQKSKDCISARQDTRLGNRPDAVHIDALPERRETTLKLKPALPEKAMQEV